MKLLFSVLNAAAALGHRPDDFCEAPDGDARAACTGGSGGSGGCRHHALLQLASATHQPARAELTELREDAGRVAPTLLHEVQWVSSLEDAKGDAGVRGRPGTANADLRLITAWPFESDETTESPSEAQSKPTEISIFGEGDTTATTTVTHTFSNGDGAVVEEVHEPGDVAAAATAASDEPIIAKATDGPMAGTIDAAAADAVHAAVKNEINEAEIKWVDDTLQKNAVMEATRGLREEVADLRKEVQDSLNRTAVVDQLMGEDGALKAAMTKLETMVVSANTQAILSKAHIEDLTAKVATLDNATNNLLAANRSLSDGLGSVTGLVRTLQTKEDDLSHSNASLWKRVHELGEAFEEQEKNKDDATGASTVVILPPMPGKDMDLVQSPVMVTADHSNFASGTAAGDELADGMREAGSNGHFAWLGWLTRVGWFAGNASGDAESNATRRTLEQVGDAAQLAISESPPEELEPATATSTTTTEAAAEEEEEPAESTEKAAAAATQADTAVANEVASRVAAEVATEVATKVAAEVVREALAAQTPPAAAAAQAAPIPTAPAATAPPIVVAPAANEAGAPQAPEVPAVPAVAAAPASPAVAPATPEEVAAPVPPAVAAVPAVAATAAPASPAVAPATPVEVATAATAAPATPAAVAAPVQPAALAPAVAVPAAPVPPAVAPQVTETPAPGWFGAAAADTTTAAPAAVTAAAADATTAAPTDATTAAALVEALQKVALPDVSAAGAGMASADASVAGPADASAAAALVQALRREAMPAALAGEQRYWVGPAVLSNSQPMLRAVTYGALPQPMLAAQLPTGEILQPQPSPMTVAYIPTMGASQLTASPRLALPLVPLSSQMLSYGGYELPLASVGVTVELPGSQ